MVDRSSTTRSATSGMTREAPWNNGEPATDELPMHLLAAGIPLTLLLDLAENFGPPSNQILEAEYGPAYADPNEAVHWLEHLIPPTPNQSVANRHQDARREQLPAARTAPDDVDPGALDPGTLEPPEPRVHA